MRALRRSRCARRTARRRAARRAASPRSPSSGSAWSRCRCARRGAVGHRARPQRPAAARLHDGRRPLAPARRAEGRRPALSRHAAGLRGQALPHPPRRRPGRHRPRRLAARPPPPHRLRRLDADHAGGAPAGTASTSAPAPARCARRCARCSWSASSPRTRSCALYLRLAPFGGNLEGVRAASLAYFGKEPRRLSLAEAALLVALPQSPELRRPDRFPEAARRARNRVLAHAAAQGVIPADEARRAHGRAHADRAPRVPDARPAPGRRRDRAETRRASCIA